jgi:nitrogen regulatory protein PII
MPRRANCAATVMPAVLRARRRRCMNWRLGVSCVVEGGVLHTETDWFGEETLIRLPIRLRLELVVPDAQVEPIIEAVLRHARTGQPDDGKIFVLPYADAIRIRTEERGEAAL